MKKIFILWSVLGLCACAGVNKNTVSYQMSKYDQQEFYVIAGEGTTKQAAAENALAAMQQNIEQNVPNVNILSQQVADLIANAKIGKTWRDKNARNPKKYFALAVLKRETGENILKTSADQLDGHLGGLVTQLQATEDKFAGLRAAFAMEPLIIKRNVLQDLYVFVSREHVGYEWARFDGYKKAYNDRLAAVKVAAVVYGEEDTVLLSRITDAINQMGLTVSAPEDETALLAVEADVQVDGYKSERLKGLEWAAVSAAISLQDLQAGTTFARFNQYSRTGTGRRADSLRKSMEEIGDKAYVEITQRLTDYLKTK